MTRVIKLGGRVQDSPALVAAMYETWMRARVGASPAVVIVHGGGDEMTALQQRFGIAAHFHEGRRVTTDQDLPLLRMTLSGVVNKRLVAALVAAGVPAVGISGEDAGMLRAREIDRLRLGSVGSVSKVDSALVDQLLGGGFCPVIAPLACDGAGGTLNVNGDEAAVAIAVALGASELLLVADVDGVIADGRTLHALDRQSANALVANGVVTGGMAVKVNAALDAAKRGVARVRIGGIAAITDARAGTLIVDATRPVTNTSPGFSSKLRSIA